VITSMRRTWCSSSSVGSSLDTSRSQSHCRISTITDRQPDKKAASEHRFPANSAGRAWAITYPTTEFGRLKSTLTIVSMKHAEHARRDALCESVGGDNIMRSTRMARSGRSPRLPLLPSHATQPTLVTNPGNSNPA
jgi:hypothetical protein